MKVIISTEPGTGRPSSVVGVFSDTEASDFLDARPGQGYVACHVGLRGTRDNPDKQAMIAAAVDTYTYRDSQGYWQWHPFVGGL